MFEAKLSELKERLYRKNIFELRQIARAAGVLHPTGGKKERLIDEITKIACGELDPLPPATRGAPPKSTEFDKQIISDVEELRAMSLQGKAAVSDGSLQTPFTGILCKAERGYVLKDISVSPAKEAGILDVLVSKFKLAEGDKIKGVCHTSNGISSLIYVDEIDDLPADGVTRRDISSITPDYPDERIRADFPKRCVLARIIDMFAPMGKGQRGVIVCPDSSRSAQVIGEIALGISLDEGIKTVVLSLNSRPEDIVCFKRAEISAECFFCGIGEDPSPVISLVGGYAKSRLSCGQDTVLLVHGASAKQAAELLSLAVCAEEGGSLAVIADVDGAEAAPLVRAANMVVTLGRAFEPAVITDGTYTLKSELLYSKSEMSAASALRPLGDGEIYKIFSEKDSKTIIETYKNG